MRYDPRGRRALALLLERREVRLQEIGERLSDSRSSTGIRDTNDILLLDEWLELGAQLPLGLVFAEEIILAVEPPSDLSPLVAGSPWYAAGNTLIVVLKPSPQCALTLLERLGRYWAVSTRMRARARGPLADGPTPFRWDGALSARLAATMGGSARALHNIESNSRVQADLQAVLETPFDAGIKIHPSFDPSHLERAGAEIANAVLATLPAGPFRVVLSDSELVLEHLSPYVRDLGSALFGWGLENRTQLSIDGLPEALERYTSSPHPDLAALVALDMFVNAAPAVLDERRRAEREVGLHILETSLGKAAWLDLSTAVSADEVAVPSGTAGLLVVLVSEVVEFLLGALRDVLASLRVTDAAVVYAASERGLRPLVPRAISDAEDGFHLHAWEAMERHARQLGMHVDLGDLVDTTADDDAGLARLLRALRRSSVRRELPEDAWSFVALYPRGAPGSPRALNERIAELNASRLLLATLLSHTTPDRSATGSTANPLKSGRSQPVRRFRA